MFYDQVNHFIDKIEASLCLDIDYQDLAKGVGINFATLQKIFPLVTDISLAEYVRCRRLTLAGRDLAQSDFRIIDIAMNYGYSSAAAFSRAFYSFHGIKPSEVKRNVKHLKCYPKIVLSKPAKVKSLDYEIVQTDEMNLCGLEIVSSRQYIQDDAPRLFQLIKEQYSHFPHPNYGLLDYDSGRSDDNNYHYCALWYMDHNNTYPDFVRYHIPAMRWLKFRILSQEAVDIQKTSTQFYEEFLPTCPYRLRPEPDLEYYHDGITDFMIPIY